MLLLVATFYFFAIIGMEGFRYQVYPQCWYDINVYIALVQLCFPLCLIYGTYVGVYKYVYS